MTIALSLKVHDGVVLAADSASTLIQQLPDGQTGVVNVYNNANKIVNLCKGLPLGVITWGAGSIGPVSITTILKDLRSMLCGATEGPDGADWALNVKNYGVDEVAGKVKQYVFDQLYTSAFENWGEAPQLGMIIAGYSSNGSHAEEYQIATNAQGVDGPNLQRQPEESGVTMGGQFETIARLVMGIDPRLPQVLVENLGVPPAQVDQAVSIIQQQLTLPLIQDAMPFADALDLAHFLVDATIKVARFLPGPDTVGGPIEVAGITKHEGFKWVYRKHYYHREFNQETG